MLKHLWNAIKEFLEGGFERRPLSEEDKKELTDIFRFLLENQSLFTKVIRDLNNLPGFPLWTETKAAFSSEKVTKVSAPASAPSGVYRAPRVSRGPSRPSNVEEVVLMTTLKEEDDGYLLVIIGDGTPNNPYRRFFGSKKRTLPDLGQCRLGLKVPIEGLPESTPAEPGVHKVLLTWTQESYNKGFWTFCGGTDKPLTIEEVSVNVECETEVWKDPRGLKKVSFFPPSFQFPRGCRIPMYEGKPCLVFFQNQVSYFYKGEPKLMCGITWLKDKSTGKSFSSIGAPVEGAPTATPYCARQSYRNGGGSGYTRRTSSSQAYRAPQGRFNSSGSSTRNSDGVYRTPRGRVAKQPRNGSFESSNWRR
jgi:hypothetical protein